jgi:hypothetical protein
MQDDWYGRETDLLEAESVEIQLVLFRNHPTRPVIANRLSI